jgi:hypothetical protein
VGGGEVAAGEGVGVTDADELVDVDIARLEVDITSLEVVVVEGTTAALVVESEEVVIGATVCSFSCGPIWLTQ